MPQNAKVIIYYGPYEACGIVEHRTSRLDGLHTVLYSDGHTVEFVETEDWNQIKLEVNGETVYKCDIRDLDYGSDGGLDKLCQEALEQVRNAF